MLSGMTSSASDDLESPVPAELDRVKTSRSDGDRVLRWIAVAALALFVVVLGVIVLSEPDPTVQGDEASYVYSALSLRDFDLTYDDVDQARWEAIGWETPPSGLFVQRHGDGWAMAKPIGYSAYLAPFLWLFGLRGIQIAGAVALTVYAAAWFYSGRLRWRWEVSALVAFGVSVASSTWWYAFPAHVDIFFAALIGVVTYGLLRASLRRDALWFWLAAGVAGLLLTEKTPAFLSLLPFVLIAAFRLGRKPAAIGGSVMVAAALLSTLPYFYYSDGASWSAYGGERYYVAETPPWSGGDESDLMRLVTDELLTPAYVLDQVTSPSSDLFGATLSYSVGRHTGVLTFMPVVPLLVGGAIMVLFRGWRRGRRRRGRVDDPDAESCSADENRVGDWAASPSSVDGLNEEPTWDAAERATPDRAVALAALLSLGLYVAFYLVLFTNNYYGGGQSIGNRYFLQFSAVAAGVVVASGLRERWAVVCVGLAVVWAALVIGPLMRHGPVMYTEFWRTTSVQRWLPYDTTQRHILGVWSGPEDIAARSGPFRFAAADLPSTTGQEVGDRRSVKSGRDPSGFVTYGPYQRLDDARFVAEVTYESPAPEHVEVLTFDVARLGEVRSQQPLTGTMGETVSSELEFTASLESGWEFRVFWPGAGEAVVHSISVKRVD